MKFNWQITIIVVSAVLIGILYYVFIARYQPKYDWGETYSANDKEPYGVKYFYKLLESSNNIKELKLINRSVNNQLQWTGKNNCYLFIGDDYMADSVETIRLLQFVKEGNIAFISASATPHWLDRLYFNKNKEFEAFVLNDKFKQIHTNILGYSRMFYFSRQFGKDTAILGNWGNFEYPLLKNLRPYRVVSVINDSYSDCIKFQYGNGVIYFHCNPILFTNFFFIKERGMDYINHALPFLAGKTVFWDEISKSYNSHTSASNYSPYNNPMRYVLSQRPLRWAFYLTLVLLILFVLFGSKRKQKPIPLVEKNRNSSSDFINAVASMYRLEKHHLFIAEEIWIQLHAFVKLKYGLDINQKDETLLEILSLKTSMSISQVDYLFKVKDAMLENPKSSVHLLEYQTIVNKFYKNCK